MTTYLYDYYLGFAEYNQRRFSEALKQLDKSIEKNEKYVFSRYLRCYTNLQLDNYEQAVQDLKSAVEIDPQYLITPFYGDKGKVSYIASTDREMMALHKKLADLEPDHAPIMWLLEQILTDEDRQEQTQIIKLPPSIVPFNHGVSYFRDRKYEKAIIMFTQMLALKSDFVPAIVLRASSYLRMQNLEAADADLDTAIKLNPTDANMFAFIGSEYEQSNEQSEKAIVMFAKAFELDPEHGFARRKILGGGAAPSHDEPLCTYNNDQLEPESPSSGSYVPLDEVLGEHGYVLSPTTTVYRSLAALSLAESQDSSAEIISSNPQLASGISSLAESQDSSVEIISSNPHLLSMKLGNIR